MAKFLVLENVVVDGATVRAGTEIDSGSTDVARLMLAGAQLYNLAVPMPADAQRALDELRQRQAKGDPEWNSMSLFAAFAANGGGGGGGVVSVSASLPLTSSGGANPNLAINPATTTTPGSMSAADKSKLDGLGTNTIVWRPGGVDGGGVVTTWAQVEAIIAATLVPLTIYVDGSLATPVIPLTADVDGKALVVLEIFRADANGVLATVQMQDGARLRNIAEVNGLSFRGQFTVRSPFEIDLAGAITVFSRGGAVSLLAGSTKAPFLVTGENAIVSLFESAGLSIGAAPANPAILIDPAVTLFTLTNVNVINSGVYPANFISGGGAGTLAVVIADSSIPAIPPQTGFLGTYNEIRYQYAAGMRPAFGTTAQRPTAPKNGEMYFDLTVGVPIFWNGTAWLGLATPLLPGFMSAADKARFDNLGSVQLVFRPGGVDGQGVVTTWAQVDAFATAAAVPWNLIYDTNLAPALVPNTAATNFKGLCTIYAVPGSNPLIVKDGGFIKNFRLSLGANVQCEAITRSGVEFDILGFVADLREGGRIANMFGVSLVPAIDINTPQMVFACLLAGAVIADEPSVPMINVTIPGSFIVLAALVNSGGGASNFSDNSIITDPTTTILEIHDTTSRLGPQALALGPIVYNPIAKSEYLNWNAGPTASRPTVNLLTGAMYYDTDLKLPIWWDGTVWQSWACFAATIGDGVSTTINVVHNLNSYDVMVQVREDAAPRATVLCDVERPDPNSVDLIFLVAPNVNELRVMVKA